MRVITNIDNLINNDTVNRRRFAKLCKKSKLSIELLEKHCEILPWDIICDTEQLDDNIIDIYSDYVEWSKVCKYPLQEWIINKYHNDVDWKVISQYQKLSQDFLIHWKKRLYWGIVCRYQTLNEGFINYMIQKGAAICNSNFCDQHAPQEKKCVIYIDLIFEYQRISDDFIVDYVEYLDIWIDDKEDLKHLNNETSQSELASQVEPVIDFEPISGWDALPYVFRKQKLSSSFIDKYWEDIHPHMLSKYQIISEDLIMDTGNHVNWNWKYLSQQHLSEELMETFYHKLHWEHVFSCDYTSQAFRDKWGKRLRELTELTYEMTQNILEQVDLNEFMNNVD